MRGKFCKVLFLLLVSGIFFKKRIDERVLGNWTIIILRGHRTEHRLRDRFSRVLCHKGPKCTFNSNQSTGKGETCTSVFRRNLNPHQLVKISTNDAHTPCSNSSFIICRSIFPDSSIWETIGLIRAFASLETIAIKETKHTQFPYHKLIFSEVEERGGRFGNKGREVSLFHACFELREAMARLQKHLKRMLAWEYKSAAIDQSALQALDIAQFTI